MNPTATKTIRVPQPFATALLADLREPGEDDERDGITDAEQLGYEREIDADVERWLTELDGDGERTLTVPLTGPAAEWFSDQLAGSVLEGLTGQLADGATEDRERVVAALGGWTTTMAQLDGLAVATLA